MFRMFMKKEVVREYPVGNFDIFPNELISYLILFLTAKDRTAFYLTCKGLLTMEECNYPFWSGTLRQLNINEELLTTILEEKKITDYKKLCKTLSRIPASERKKISDPWVLYSLSGDMSVFEDTCKKYSLTLDIDDLRAINSWLIA